jgi:hypothetical protein
MANPDGIAGIAGALVFVSSKFQIPSSNLSIVKVLDIEYWKLIIGYFSLLSVLQNHNMLAKN